MHWLEKIPLLPLAIAALLLALAPVSPQPHLIEKLGMLWDGTLQRPLDILDLVLHGSPLLLLLVKLSWQSWRTWQSWQDRPPQDRT